MEIQGNNAKVKLIVLCHSAYPSIHRGRAPRRAPRWNLLQAISKDA